MEDEQDACQRRLLTGPPGAHPRTALHLGGVGMAYFTRTEESRQDAQKSPRREGVMTMIEILERDGDLGVEYDYVAPCGCEAWILLDRTSQESARLVRGASPGRITGARVCVSPVCRNHQADLEEGWQGWGMEALKILGFFDALSQSGIETPLL